MHFSLSIRAISFFFHRLAVLFFDSRFSFDVVFLICLHLIFIILLKLNAVNLRISFNGNSNLGVREEARLPHPLIFHDNFVGFCFHFKGDVLSVIILCPQDRDGKRLH